MARVFNIFNKFTLKHLRDIITYSQSEPGVFLNNFGCFSGKKTVCPKSDVTYNSGSFPFFSGINCYCYCSFQVVLRRRSAETHDT